MRMMICDKSRRRRSFSATKKNESISNGMATAGSFAVQSPMPKKSDFPLEFIRLGMFKRSSDILPSMSGSFCKSVIISVSVFIGAEGRI